MTRQCYEPFFPEPSADEPPNPPARPRSRRRRRAGTHEESRAENDKDTRAIEASYLALGLARRVVELRPRVETRAGAGVRDPSGEETTAAARRQRRRRLLDPGRRVDADFAARLGPGRTMALGADAEALARRGRGDPGDGDRPG